MTQQHAEAILDSASSIATPAEPLRTVKTLATRYHDITSEQGLRAQIYDAEDRIASNGQVIKGNGLAAAIIRVRQPGKKRGKVLINEDRWLRWLKTGNAA